MEVMIAMTLMSTYMISWSVLARESLQGLHQAIRDTQTLGLVQEMVETQTGVYLNGLSLGAESAQSWNRRLETIDDRLVLKITPSAGSVSSVSVHSKDAERVLSLGPHQ